MQLNGSSRREVVEDLLDIKIFSSMNSLIKEKIRMVREEVKTFELKKESLKDKSEMQENFIKELEEQGKNNIQEKDDKIKVLSIEVDTHMEHNQLKESTISDLMEEQKKVSGSDDKLVKQLTIQMAMFGHLFGVNFLEEENTQMKLLIFHSISPD